MASMGLCEFPRSFLFENASACSYHRSPTETIQRAYWRRRLSNSSFESYPWKVSTVSPAFDRSQPRPQTLSIR